MISPTSALLQRKYVPPEITSAAPHRHVNSVAVTRVWSPMSAWNKRPARAHASTYWATLNVIFSACFLPSDVADQRCERLRGDGQQRTERQEDGERERRRSNDLLDATGSRDRHRLDLAHANEQREDRQLEPPAVDDQRPDPSGSTPTTLGRQPERPLLRTPSRESFPAVHRLAHHSLDAHSPVPMVGRALGRARPEVTCESTPLDAIGVGTDGDHEGGDHCGGGEETGGDALPFDLHCGRVSFLGTGPVGVPSGSQNVCFRRDRVEHAEGAMRMWSLLLALWVKGEPTLSDRTPTSGNRSADVDVTDLSARNQLRYA